MRRLALHSTLVFPLVAACVPGGMGLRAQDAHRDTLATVVITATRMAISTASPIVAATVLRGEDLRAQGITRVAEALSLGPGAAVVASGD